MIVRLAAAIIALAVVTNATLISLPQKIPVKTSVTYCVAASQKSSNCKTWNEYLAAQKKYFTTNVAFYFLPGVHFMNQSLTVSSITNLHFFANSSHDVILIGGPSKFSFFNFSNVAIEGMNITLCAPIDKNTPTDTGILHFSNGSDVTVRNTILHNMCDGSEIYAESVRNMLLVSLNITRMKANNSCGALCFNLNVAGSIKIENSTFFVSNPSENYTFINFGPPLITNTSIVIENCSFVCGIVLEIHLGTNAFLALNKIYADGCLLNSVPGFSILGTNGTCNISNSNFTEFNSVLYTYYISMSIENSYFDSNGAPRAQQQQQTASVLSIHDPGLHRPPGSYFLIKNVTFYRNGYTVGRYSIPDSPTVMIYSSLEPTTPVVIRDCNFSSNYGHALYVYRSTVQFSGTTKGYNFMYFMHNIGYEGAAMYLDKGATLQFESSFIFIENNQADYTGGAIQIAGMDSENPSCPFDFTGTQPFLNSRLCFFNNSAGSGGDAIYGGYLDQSVYKPDLSLRCIQVLRKYSGNNEPDCSIFHQPMSLISSQPSRVCLCNSRNEPDCLNVFSVQDAYPGEDRVISLVVVGQTFGTSAGYVYAQLLQGNDDASTADASLDKQQDLQLVNQYECNHLTYTINAKPGKHILVLTTKVGLIQDYILDGNATVQAIIDEYNENNHSFVPKSLLDYPVYINFTLNSCPPGFSLAGSPPKCSCFENLRKIDGVNCNINTKQVERSGTVWVELEYSDDNTTDAAVVFSKYCPYNYCNPEKVNIFMSPSLQCQYNHTGRLCGKCPNGRSLTLGKPQCRKCSSVHLYLIPLFAFSGIVLVVFIKVTDFTVAGGLINGLILYANLVEASENAYFATTSNSNSQYLKVLQTFIDWLNLDLGIETCFFDGMNGYWKTWLQFVFPIYIWAIALSIILLARYSMRMARLLGNNSVPVLATLFTLSYAKLFRTIITAFFFTSIEYPDGNKVRIVWSYDGTITYLNTKHSVLFAVALLVFLCLWLPYICVLLFGQCLQKCNQESIGRLVNRMKPLFDAHYGPFKDKHRYWFGILLVARAVPLVIGASTPLSNEKITPLSTIAVVGALLVMNSRVYKKLYVFLSEALFLLNLLFLAASSLYTSSLGAPEHQKWFTTVLVGIAFVQFICILAFSTVRHYFRCDIAAQYERINQQANIDHSNLDESRHVSDM